MLQRARGATSVLLGGVEHRVVVTGIDTDMVGNAVTDTDTEWQQVESLVVVRLREIIAVIGGDVGFGEDGWSHTGTDAKFATVAKVVGHHQRHLDVKQRYMA